jgi:hypothetical protein
MKQSYSTEMVIFFQNLATNQKINALTGMIGAAGEGARFEAPRARQWFRQRTFVCAAHAMSWSWSLRWASTTATAVMLTMPRAVIDGVSICAGLAAPSRTGPTGKASVMTLVSW